MITENNIQNLNKEKQARLQHRLSSLRYWLFGGLLIAALAYGIHRYFEYRTHELDKRLELLQ